MTSIGIGLLGAFGIGNRGNDVTLDAFVDGLEGALAEVRADAGEPPVHAVAVVPAPESVARPGIETVAWTRPRTSRSRAARLRARFADLAWAWRVVGDLDAVVLAGGGLLEVTRLRAAPTAWTVTTYTWCARLRRRPVIFWSIGADDLPRGPARLLVRAALRGATTITVRDAHSVRAVEALGAPTPSEVLDVVLSLPVRDRTPDGGARPSVAVGVFNARGATAADGSALDADRYESELVRTVCGLVGGGRDIVLFGGAAIDADVIETIVTRCQVELGHQASHLRTAAYDDYDTMRDTVATTDLAVVSRYHGTVAALTSGIPTVSLGYGPKNRDLMARFGQVRYCADLPVARAQDVHELVDQLESRATTEAAAIREVAETLRERALAEFRELAGLLPAAGRPVDRIRS